MKLSDQVGMPIEPKDIELSSAIIATKFHLFQAQNLDKSCNTFLFLNKIIIEIQNDSVSNFYEIAFQYDLKCLLSQKNDFQGDFKMDDQICYIKLFKNKCILQFKKPQKEEHFKVWKDVLQRRLMQFGFYQNYTPINQLGQGNFAKIFLAQNNISKQYGALKTFSKKQLFHKLNGRQSFINEINAMRMFNHDNLLKINEVYENEHSLFICIELLSGGTLMDKINEKFKFNSVQVKAIMKSLLCGVEEMHKKKIMHRDLKPDNILFRHYDSNECIIGDFGLAEHVLSPVRIFNVCGTPGFVAPEILKAPTTTSGQHYDQTCDIFSLGVILHMILLGTTPFYGETLDELFQNNKQCNINFDQFEYHQLPNTWLTFLKQLLEVDPKKRLTATQALAHNFFKKQPLVKKHQKPRKTSEEMYEIDIENTINIHQFDEILKKRSKRNSKVLKMIENSSKNASKQNKSSQKAQSSGKSIKSLNSPVINAKKTKPQQSKFRDIAYNNS